MVDSSKTETLPVYQNPTSRIFGPKTFERLPAVLEKFHPRRILLVLGQKSFRQSPHFEKLHRMLGSYTVIESMPVGSNPKQNFIQDEIHRLRREAFDVVLAIGGGSVLDVAKLLAVIPRQEVTDLSAYIKKTAAVLAKKTPLVAVPTTAGTGSEVTPFASLETEDRQKITLSDRELYPTMALIDPELSVSMPAYVTACTGFDALSQAIESFWSIHATSFSRTHALRSLELICMAFPEVIDNPGDSRARSAMSLASSEAGLAIAQTKTTAVHSISYPITTHFSVAHGHACALTLSSFVLFNAPVLKEEGRPLLSRFQTSTYEEMAKAIDRMMEHAGLERHLSRLGIDRQGFDLILRDGFRPDRINNNPRPVSREDLSKMLTSIR